MATDDEDAERRRNSQNTPPLSRGPQGPNHYQELKPQSEPQSGDPGQTQPDAPVQSQRRASESPRDVVWRERERDNRVVVEETARQQHELTRAEHDRKVDADALENAKALARQANEMRDVRTRFDALGQNPIHLIEEKALQRDANSPRDFYQRALNEQHDPSDPYGTLERAATAEYAAFSADQKRRSDEIAKERNPDTRHSLEQMKDIQAANYLAATSHRIADQSEIITGVNGNEEAARFRKRAAGYEAESRALQDDYRQRTGRSAVAVEQTSERDEPEPTRSSTAGERDRGEPASRKKGETARADGNQEMTDAQVERLARLKEKEAGAEGKSWALVDKPVRPRGTGGAER